MGNSKIILVNGNNETNVASCRALSEALMCASLLQAMVVTPGFFYHVECKIKGQIKRITPDPFLQIIAGSAHLTNLLKPPAI